MKGELYYYSIWNDIRTIDDKIVDYGVHGFLVEVAKLITTGSYENEIGRMARIDTQGEQKALRRARAGNVVFVVLVVSIVICAGLVGLALL